MDKEMKNMIKVRNKIIAIISLIAFYAYFLLVMIGWIVQRAGIDKNFSEAWEASRYYPFADTSEGADFDRLSQLERISEKITVLETKIEAKGTSEFVYQMPCVLAKKKFDKMLGLDMTTSLCAGENNPTDVYDIIVPYQDDYLGQVIDNTDITAGLDSLVDFGEQMENEGRNFLFFVAPGKYVNDKIWIDYSEEKMEELRATFRMNHLDLCCVSDVLEQEGVDYTDYFFKTDHHWLPSTGIWADHLLCKELNYRYNYRFNTSAFNIDHYENRTLDKLFFGSLGRKVTEVYCPKEEFPIIVPKYDTDLDVFISSKNEMTHGSIEDTLLDESVFEEENLYQAEYYWYYGYGDRALITIHNNQIHDGSHILMLKTSYADCMYPYLASVVEDLDIIDLRVFDGSLQSYIEKTNPDTVVMVYGMAAFLGSQTINGLFDFR